MLCEHLKDISESRGRLTGRWGQEAPFGKIDAKKGRRVTSYRSGLPVRVIVLDGKPSEVSARLLDPIPWAVIAYDETTGEAVVRRGAAPSAYTDQFSLPPPRDGAAGTRNVTTTVRNRDREVRDFALSRAQGKCELCGATGFQLPDGRTFLETHHVVPLAEGGADSASNVVALCPNHHREVLRARCKEYSRAPFEDAEPIVTKRQPRRLSTPPGPAREVGRTVALENARSDMS